MPVTRPSASRWMRPWPRGSSMRAVRNVRSASGSRWAAIRPAMVSGVTSGTSALRTRTWALLVAACCACATAWPVPSCSACWTQRTEPSRTACTCSAPCPTTTTKRALPAGRLEGVARGCEDVQEHGPAGDGMQRLRLLRAHALAEAGRQDYRCPAIFHGQQKAAAGCRSRDAPFGRHSCAHRKRQLHVYRYYRYLQEGRLVSPAGATPVPPTNSIGGARALSRADASQGVQRTAVSRRWRGVALSSNACGRVGGKKGVMFAQRQRPCQAATLRIRDDRLESARAIRLTGSRSAKYNPAERAAIAPRPSF